MVYLKDGRIKEGFGWGRDGVCLDICIKKTNAGLLHVSIMKLNEQMMKEKNY